MPTTEDVFLAITNGNGDELEDLLRDDPPPSPERVTLKGVSAVLAARYAGHHELADRLVAAGPELDVFDAAAVGDTDRLRTLLDEHPDAVSAVCPDGFSALHLASFSYGHCRAAELLPGRGADPEAVAVNASQLRPLNSAAAAGHETIAHLLLDHGADVDARQAGGFSVPPLGGPERRPRRWPSCCSIEEPTLAQQPTTGARSPTSPPVIPRCSTSSSHAAPSGGSSSGHPVEQPPSRALDLVTEQPLQHRAPQGAAVVQPHREQGASVRGGHIGLQHPGRMRAAVELPCARTGRPGARRCPGAGPSATASTGLAARAGPGDRPTTPGPGLSAWATGSARVTISSQRGIPHEVLDPDEQLLSPARGGQLGVEVHRMECAVPLRTRPTAQPTRRGYCPGQAASASSSSALRATNAGSVMRAEGRGRASPDVEVDPTTRAGPRRQDHHPVRQVRASPRRGSRRSRCGGRRATRPGARRTCARRVMASRAPNGSSSRSTGRSSRNVRSKARR